MKILVTFALEPEFAPWRRLRSFQETKWTNESTAFVAKISGAEVFAMITGMGRARAARAIFNIMLGEAQSIDFCVSSGFCGSLRSEHKPGDILSARSVYSETISSDYPKHDVPGDPSLIAIAARCGATVVPSFYASGRLIASPDEKASLGKLASAVDMESFEILREAGAWGIKAIPIRVVTDGVGESLPLDFEPLLDARGNVDKAKLAKSIVRAPHKLPALVRLGRNSRRAAKNLALFLDAFLSELSRSQPRPLEHVEAVRA